MIVYAYQATDRNGAATAGEISAQSVSSAVAELEQRGLAVRSIQEIAKQMQSEPVVAKVVPASELHRRIDLALEHREPLIAALEALAEDMPKDRGRKAVRRLATQLAGGLDAAQLLADPQSAVWLPLVVRGITAESTAKKLSDSLDAVLREDQMRRQRASALAYPTAMLAVTLLVLGALCVFVVPAFAKMYQEFGLALPAPTILLFWITDQLTIYAARTAVLALGIAAVGYLLLRLWFSWSLHTRFFGFFTAGNSNIVGSMAGFTHQLAELVSLDATLPEALRIAGGCCRHAYLKSVAESLAVDAQACGSALSNCPNARNLPPTLILALQSAPDGGPSVPLLRELASMYGERVRMRFDWAWGSVGPVAVFVVGVMVFLIVVSLFMPLVSMVSSLA